MTWLVAVAAAYVQAVGIATAGQAPDLWTWFTASVSVDAILNTLGLGALAVLFATDRIMTKGQHERRVADLTKAYDARIAVIESGVTTRVADLMDAHTAALGAKDERYQEMRESRGYWRDLANELENRVKELTDGLLESNRGLGVAARAMQEVSRAAQEKGT